MRNAEAPMHFAADPETNIRYNDLVSRAAIPHPLEKIQARS